MATAKRTKKEEEDVSFEQAMVRLEDLVGKMEEGQDLEKMMAFFEEGTRLVKLCNEKLNEVEKKIEKLVEKDGSLETEPFSPEDG